MDLQELKLTKKTYEALLNANIHDVDTIKEMSDNELLQLKGINNKGLEEIHKKRNNITTPKERRERDLQDKRNTLRFIPEPTYFFSIGDEVEIGNLTEVKVVQSFDSGKIYEIDYTRTDNNYGNPIRHKNQRMFVNWMEIRKKNYNQDSFVNNREIRLSYFQTGLQSIFSKVYYFGTNLDPEYQREYVWELEDKIKLIDSIFNHVDIGKFAFITLHDYSQDYLYEVLDGKQRVKAILDFYEDRFEYKGKKFSELSNRDKNHFTDYPISIAEVKDPTYEQKLQYFLHLNTGGKVMSEEHINKVRNMLNKSK